jgi:hypothetical protein
MQQVNSGAVTMFVGSALSFTSPQTGSVPPHGLWGVPFCLVEHVPWTWISARVPVDVSTCPIWFWLLASERLPTTATLFCRATVLIDAGMSSEIFAELVKFRLLPAKTGDLTVRDWPNVTSWWAYTQSSELLVGSIEEIVGITIGTTAVAFLVTGDAVGPVGFVTLPVAVKSHSQFQKEPAGAATKEPDQRTVPVG